MLLDAAHARFERGSRLNAISDLMEYYTGRGILRRVWRRRKAKNGNREVLSKVAMDSGFAGRRRLAGLRTPAGALNGRGPERRPTKIDVPRMKTALEVSPQARNFASLFELRRWDHP
jgi:hypothetical protein